MLSFKYPSRIERIFGEEIPNVINMKMSCYAIKDHWGIGNDERMKLKDDDFDFKMIKRLRLDYRNILIIESLEYFTSLVELYLDNNIIEKMTGLDNLVNLKILNLSFNKIKDIRGLTNLLKLQELNLYHNEIEHLTNLDHLNELKYLSIGHNRISQIVQLEHLFPLKKLVYLNLKENQFENEEEVKKFTFVCLNQVKFYNNKYISEEIIPYQEVDKQYYEMLEKKYQKNTSIKNQKFHADQIDAMNKVIGADRVYDGYISKNIFKADVNGKIFLDRFMLLENIKMYSSHLNKCSDEIYRLIMLQNDAMNAEINLMRSEVDKAIVQSNSFGKRMVMEIETKRNEVMRKTKLLDDTDILDNLYSDLYEKLNEFEMKIIDMEEYLKESITEAISELKVNLDEMITSLKEKLTFEFEKINEICRQYHKQINSRIVNAYDKIDEDDDQLTQIFPEKESLLSGLTQSFDHQLNFIESIQDYTIEKLNDSTEVIINKLTKEYIQDQSLHRLNAVTKYCEKEFRDSYESRFIESLD